jgi:hypothetical protein
MVAVLCAMGCATSSVDYVSLMYYFEGPEVALDAIQYIKVLPGDRSLIELERSMALLELGRYDASNSALDRAERFLDADEAAGWVSESGLPPWRPEYHERVLIHTLRITNHLALQDVVAAADAADRALYAINRINCGACRFAFTRYIAAVAYDRAGRFRDGLVALRDTDVVGPGEKLISDLRGRLEHGVVSDQPAGFAPPPVGPERTLVVLLLLGRGPYKEADELALTESETIRWSSYLPRDPQEVTWAALEGGMPLVSVALTDVEDLAVASLRQRAERVIGDGGVGIDPTSRDLRHWGTLPASLQLLNVWLPPDAGRVDLVYFSPEGIEIDRETIELPEGWTDGPLFVARRMP